MLAISIIWLNSHFIPNTQLDKLVQDGLIVSLGCFRTVKMEFPAGTAESVYSIIKLFQNYSIYSAVIHLAVDLILLEMCGILER